MALNLLMLGPPGAGKGTQAERFAKARGIPKISTGDILREAVHTKTEIGLRAKAVMDRGELVGDDVMIGIVRERLERPDAMSGFVLDGFPRTVAQASALDGIMIERDPLIVVDIVVPEEELVRRLGTRSICRLCGTGAPVGSPVGAACVKCGGRLVQRTDDNQTVVLERLKVYHRQSEPLVEYYRVRPTFRSIDGAQAPGVTTADLDELAETRIRKAGATPAFKGYHGYPATICASVNEEVIHGIPSGRRVLVDGDVISIDVGAELNGYFGDSAITLAVGRVSEEAATLLRVTDESLYKAIEAVKPGGRISDIGHAVQKHVEAYGFSVVREFVGHGIGQKMHEEPQVPNYGEPGRGPRLTEGMVLAIEPMVNAGKAAVKVLADGWTAVTRDGSLSAHFEHTVAVTADGPWILTAREVPVAARK
jgi:methionyl aminopeptidase